METIFVFSPLMEESEPLEGLTDDEMLTIAEQYLDKQKRAAELYPSASDELVAGSEQTKYLKRLGHRLLSAEDLNRIIMALGTAEDREAIENFSQAQRAITQRIKTAKAKGIILTQAEISLPEWRKRQVDPTHWKADQIIRVIEVLKRIRV